MDKQLNPEVLKKISALKEYKGIDLIPMKGNINIREEILNQIPFFYLDIKIVNVSASDLEYVIDRLQKIKIELEQKECITLNHIRLNSQ